MSAPTIKTESGHNFHATGDGSRRQYLFSVSPGIPMLDALQSASNLLSTMEGAIYDAAMGQPLKDNSAWLVSHTLESAKAVIDSLIDGLEEAERSRLADDKGESQ